MIPAAPPLAAKSNVSVDLTLTHQLPHGAISFSVGKDRYYAHRGVYYRRGKAGYYVVPAPRGAVVRQLPRRSVRLVINSRTYYRYDNVYYVRVDGGYRIVPPPANTATVVSEPAPDPMAGYQSVWLGEQEYRFKDGQFFKPTSEGLVWIIAPTGAIIRELPENAVVVWHNEIEYFDVDDVIFRKTPDGYKVVTRPWE
jgi:hypothetical protein